MQQGLAYAETLDVPFVFSSNGDGFLFHDRTGTLLLTGLLIILFGTGAAAQNATSVQQEQPKKDAEGKKP